MRPFSQWVSGIASALAVAIAPDGRGHELMPDIAAVAASAPTWCSNEQAPSSALKYEEGLQLAQALAAFGQRDIAIATVAATGSMRPFFDEGALLLLEAVPFEQLRIGDVVTFWHPKLRTIVVHRLTQLRNGAFYARGDHNRRSDDVYVTPENYRRRLVGVIYLQPQTPRAQGGLGAPGDVTAAPGN